MGHYDNSKAYKIWVPQTNTVLKARDAILMKPITSRELPYTEPIMMIYLIYGHEPLIQPSQKLINH